MSVVPFPIRNAPPFAAAAAPYYQTERSTERVVQLRSLTAVEQMYAYWGSDRA